MRVWHILLLILLPALAQTAAAGEITPLANPLPAAPNRETALTIAGGERRITLTLADIEKLPMHETMLKTPWGINGTYQGVLLSDLLAEYRLHVENELLITALDSYVSNIPAGKLRGRAFLATRLSGKPIPRTARGPLILLWPEEEESALKLGVTPHSWVWSISQFTVQ